MPPLIARPVSAGTFTWMPSPSSMFTAFDDIRDRVLQSALARARSGNFFTVPEDELDEPFAVKRKRSCSDPNPIVAGLEIPQRFRERTMTP